MNLATRATVRWRSMRRYKLSVALMLERLVFFLRFSSPASSKFLAPLSQGRLEEVREQLSGKKGMKAAAILAAINAA